MRTWHTSSRGPPGEEAGLPKVNECKAGTMTETQPIEIGPLGLQGLLTVPDGATGIVLFVHGSGSSRLSPRNTHVAHAFNEARLATLLFDLLSPSEAHDRHRVFDIPLLAGGVGGGPGRVREEATGHALREWL